MSTPTSSVLPAPTPRPSATARRIAAMAVLACLSPLALAQSALPATTSPRVPAAPAPLPSRPAPTAPGAIEQWGFDPAVLVADGTELLARAPDPAIDRLFQAVHASSQDPSDAQVLCKLFDPQADRSLAGLNAIASGLAPASQERFANAVAEVFVAAMQNPPQPWDPAAAEQALKAAGVRAALLNDGFSAGLNGDDHPARCRSVAMLLDAVQQRPLPERAAVTRLLLSQGLQQLAGNPDTTAHVR
ncbi:hypothetical protein [Novilysobacter erysipheiresistens]|uniref:Uncharacterized protein n=1 Tax=Novilysobacter erysipheiresistens TaxID=1749332 RepID=A0ABU7YYD0_9GAMM